MPERPRRILYAIETSQAGGSQVAMLTLADHIDRDRFEPIFALPAPGWLSERLAERKIQTVFVANAVGGRGFDWRLLGSLVGCIRAHDIDLVHAFLFGMNFYGTLAGKVTQRPVIVSLRSTQYDFAKPHRIWCWRLMRRWSAAIAAVSHDAARTLAGAAGVPSSEITVIHNGVEVSRFPQAPGGTRPPDLPPAPLIATVGRVCEVKGQEHLIRALPRIQQLAGAVSVAILGEKTEPTYGRLRQLAEKLRVADHIYFAGLRNDIAELLPWADVFALPSLSEGISNALLEAMAARRPIVATDVGGNPELIRNGEEGLLVPAADPAALAEAIARLITDADFAEPLAAQARKRACEDFSIEAMVRGHERLYERVLGFGPR
jgi:glycosyltransferase involved in cell wall biosynthesis